MNAGWIERTAPALLLALASCERIVPEPPPPASRHDVAPAPPGALGARAAGTDSAPKPPGWRSSLGSESDSAEPEEEGLVEPEPVPPPGGPVPNPGTGVPL